MRSKARVALAILIGGALVWIVEACVGDNPETGSTSNEAGAATGDRGGPCFPDGKCKEGLVCDGVVCALLDGGGSSSSGGSSSGSPGDSATDGPTDAGCFFETFDQDATPAVCFTKGVPCTEAGADICCASATAAQCQSGGTCAASGLYTWGCVKSAECNGGNGFCALVGTLEPSVCKDDDGGTLVPSGNSVCYVNPGDLPAGSIVLCTNNNPCGAFPATPFCRPTDVVLGGKRYVLGTCRK